MHRRNFLQGSAVAPAVVMTAMHGGVTGRALNVNTAAADTLDGLRAEIATLAASWGVTTPEDAITVLYDLEHRADILSRGARLTQTGVEWDRTRAQILLMEAQALTDSGRPADAMRSAVAAINAGAQAGDTVSTTHGRVLAATVARAAGWTADPGKLLMHACSSSSGGFAVAIARAARADAMARGGAPPADVWSAVQVTEAADLGSGQPGFALDGWDPATRAAHLGGTLAKAGLAAPARDRLDEATAAYGPGADGQIQRPGAFAMVLLYRSRLDLTTGDLDGAEAHATRALDVAKPAPSAIVAAGAFALAGDARAAGGRWDEIRSRSLAARPV